MKKKVIAAAAATSIALLIAIPTIAHSAGYKGDCERGGMMRHGKGDRGKYKGEDFAGPMSGRMMERMSSALDLTEAQETEIKSIVDASRDKREQSRESMQENRQALRDLDPAAADYDAKVEEYASVLSDMQKERILERAEVRKQIDAVLTEEQQEKLAEWKSERGGKSKRWQ